jgi:hypothetical protein
MRRFAPWLVGLFLFAQIAGVVPLMFDHTFHSFEGQPAAAAHDHGAPGQHGDHRHGAGDVKDECCTLYHLIGVIPLAIADTPAGSIKVRVDALPPNPLVITGPDRLDRPPKSLLSI